jgi:hypothetical protein
MTIQAIETRYRGCRFRSRLEARWAVFFDALNIKWEYEPQGYLVGPHSTPYLPDFWLPPEGLWVEVKGAEEQIDVELLVNAVIPHRGLPAPPSSLHVAGYDVRLLILGRIDEVARLTETDTQKHVGYCQPTHAVLSFRNGEVVQGDAYFAADRIEIQPDGGTVGRDGPRICWDTRFAEWGNWVGGGSLIGHALDEIGHALDERVADAYRAARSARFEHGESGA